MAIYLQNTFLLTYNVCKSTKVKDNYPDSRHNVNKFKEGVIIAVEFQLVLRNFKASKKINIVKNYLFRFFGVYLIDKLILSTMSMT